MYQKFDEYIFQTKHSVLFIVNLYVNLYFYYDGLYNFVLEKKCTYFIHLMKLYVPILITLSTFILKVIFFYYTLEMFVVGPICVLYFLVLLFFIYKEHIFYICTYHICIYILRCNFSFNSCFFSEIYNTNFKLVTNF